MQITDFEYLESDDRIRTSSVERAHFRTGTVLVISSSLAQTFFSHSRPMNYGQVLRDSHFFLAGALTFDYLGMRWDFLRNSDEMMMMMMLMLMVVRMMVVVMMMMTLDDDDDDGEADGDDYFIYVGARRHCTLARIK